MTPYMRACKFDGWVSFWRTIYVLPGFEHDLRLCAYWLTNSYGLAVSPSVTIKMLTE